MIDDTGRDQIPVFMNKMQNKQYLAMKLTRCYWLKPLISEDMGDSNLMFGKGDKISLYYVGFLLVKLQLHNIS